MVSSKATMAMAWTRLRALTSPTTTARRPPSKYAVATSGSIRMSTGPSFRTVAMVRRKVGESTNTMKRSRIAWVSRSSSPSCLKVVEQSACHSCARCWSTAGDGNGCEPATACRPAMPLHAGTSQAVPAGAPWNPPVTAPCQASVPPWSSCQAIGPPWPEADNGSLGQWGSGEAARCGREGNASRSAWVENEEEPRGDAGGDAAELPRAEAWCRKAA